MDIQLSDATQRRAALLGTPGAVWIQELYNEVGAAPNHYGLRFLTTAEGGSESYSALAQGSTGIRRILKMLMSSDADVSAEIVGLQAANGRGCIRVLEFDVSKGIVVMERLGSPIAESGLTNLTADIESHPRSTRKLAGGYQATRFSSWRAKSRLAGGPSSSFAEQDRHELRT